MYSSMDNPTYEEWLIEYDRLMRNLRNNTYIYSQKLMECMKAEDTFMMEYYCLKLLKANKELEFGKVELGGME